MSRTLQLTALQNLTNKIIHSAEFYGDTVVFILEDSTYLILELEDVYGGQEIRVRQEGFLLQFLSEQHPLVLQGIISLAEVRAARELQTEKEQQRLKARERETYERLKAIYEKA